MAYVRITGELLEPMEYNGRINITTKPIDQLLEENGYKLSNPRPNGVYAVEFNIEGLGINQHSGNEVVIYFSQRPVMDNHYPNQRRIFARILQTMGGNSGWFELEQEAK